MSRAEEAFRQLAIEVADLKRTLQDAGPSAAPAGDPTLTRAAFDKLHQELQQYKQGFLDDLERPLLVDLLMLHDSLLWFQSTLVTKQLPQATIADHFQFLVDQLLEILERRDVTRLDTSATFDPARQRAVQVEAAPNKQADQTVARVLKRGFRWGDKPLRPEEVSVYRWREE